MIRAPWLIVGFALAMLLNPAAGHTAQPKPDAVKIAIITFFSGSGAVAGGPTVDSAKLAIEKINHAGGIAGVPLEARYIDESGGPTKQVAEFRFLAARVAAVVGYASSADCLAVEPVAEELHVLTIFSDCNSNALYKGQSDPWVFDTIPPASASALAMALYVAKTYPNLKTIAGINPDYAFGRDEWRDFTLAMHRLEPTVRFGPALFPALFSGHYTSELSRLQAVHPSLIFSSLWGGDVVALIQQAMAQGAFKGSLFALPAATQGGLAAMKALPSGVLVGAEHGYLFHPGQITDAEVAGFVSAFHTRFGQYPVSPFPFTIQRALLALRAGYEAASRAAVGWPTTASVAHALVGLDVGTVLGTFEIRSDHQATVGEMDGISTRTTSYPFAVFNHIIQFPPGLIIAPVGPTPEQWIGQLTPAILAKLPPPRQYKP